MYMVSRQPKRRQCAWPVDLIEPHRASLLYHSQITYPMSNIYLINQTTFQSYEDIAVNIKPQRLQVFIKKAQDLDLKPFLGHALYYDFIQYFNTDGSIQDSAPQP